MPHKVTLNDSKLAKTVWTNAAFSLLALGTQRTGQSAVYGAKRQKNDKAKHRVS